jgi:biopolymer transport protein ExbD
MRIARPQTRSRGEPMLPMINVAVLLLVLLAVGARLEPADSLPVTLPQAEGAPLPEGAARLFVSADGDVAFNALRGDAAIAAAAEAGTVRLHADATLSGRELVGVLQALGQAGLRDAQMVVIRP